MCPRSGYVILDSRVRTYVMKTTCKTWGCDICRTKVLSYVKMRMEYGCLILGAFYLITVTLKTGSEHARDAVAVRMVWEQLIRFLKLRSPNLTWFKIVELTKAGTPHLHLLVGGLTKRQDSCERRGGFRHTLVKVHRTCKVDCLIHEWGKAWYAVTGDSFVVDAREGYSPARLANYLGKYLSKGFYHRQDLKDLGFKRRWSCARNWPKPKKMETRMSSEGGWDKVEMVKGYGMRDYLSRRADADQHSYQLEQVGDDLRMELSKARAKFGIKRKLEKMLAQRAT